MRIFALMISDRYKCHRLSALNISMDVLKKSVAVIKEEAGKE